MNLVVGLPVGDRDRTILAFVINVVTGVVMRANNIAGGARRLECTGVFFLPQHMRCSFYFFFFSRF